VHLFPTRWLFICLLLASQSGQADPGKDFLAAREAYAKGQAERFQRHAGRVPTDHPLQPYLEYWRLKQNAPDPEGMADFVARRSDTPLSERLRQDLARLYGQAEDWPAFGRWANGLGKLDSELQCMHMSAGLASGNPTATTEAARTYRTGLDLPSSCTRLFDVLFARGLLRDEDRLIRLRLALDANNLRLARELDAQLPAEERLASSLLTEVQRQPEKVLAQIPANRAEREVGLYALTQVAKKDPGQAALLWESHAPRYTADEQRHGWGQIALQAARQHHPDAVAYFAKTGTQLNEIQQIWRVRTMLRTGRWVEVYRGIMAMPEATQNEPAWRYWKARALKALNAPYPANLILAPLSQEFGYYGLLANEELPTRVEARAADYKVSPEDMRFVEGHAGLARALLLRKLGLTIDAAREWEWAIREFDDRHILAAADLARRESWFDRAIITAERTRDLHSLDLRYVTPYRDLAETYAGQQDLDPAWVYGLMRQESRFVDYARSGVGAQGLMQIMPATARWIAQQLGLGRNAHKQVNQPETNIRFGTYYLRRIQDDLAGSPVLATAAYNAGPSRAKRWQADTPLEGAIYVESIPYAETREYVKKVLANAMYYSQRLGLPGARLKDRLGEVPPRPPRLPENHDTKA
jgi:soluble lytic murein transglycosylase